MSVIPRRPRTHAGDRAVPRAHDGGGRPGGAGAFEHIARRHGRPGGLGGSLGGPGERRRFRAGARGARLSGPQSPVHVAASAPCVELPAHAPVQRQSAARQPRRQRRQPVRARSGSGGRLRVPVRRRATSASRRLSHRDRQGLPVLRQVRRRAPGRRDPGVALGARVGRRCGQLPGTVFAGVGRGRVTHGRRQARGVRHAGLGPQHGGAAGRRSRHGLRGRGWPRADRRLRSTSSPKWPRASAATSPTSRPTGSASRSARAATCFNSTSTTARERRSDSSRAAAPRTVSISASTSPGNSSERIQEEERMYRMSVLIVGLGILAVGCSDSPSSPSSPSHRRHRRHQGPTRPPPSRCRCRPPTRCPRSPMPMRAAAARRSSP